MTQQAEERHLKVGDFMSSPVVTVRPDTDFVDAVQMMILKGVGNLAVVEGEKVDGIITERDLLNRVLGEHVDIEDKVGSSCTHPVVTARLGIAANDAAKVMFSYKIKRLPLTKGNKIVAMVTARDLVEAFQTGS